MLDELFIFLEPGADPELDRIVKERDIARTHMVFVPDAAAAAAVAVEMADAGVRLIELYRGVGLSLAATVIEAVAGRVPVGVASYTLELPVGEAAAVDRWACLYDDPASDPAVDRVVRAHGGAQTTIVGVPDDAAAARVAVELVGEGVKVIEVCGGAPLTQAARVRAAVGDSVSVGHVRWPLESLDGVNAYKAAYESEERALRR